MLSFRCLLIGLLMCHGGLGSLEVFSANRENILRQDAGTCKGAISKSSVQDFVDQFIVVNSMSLILRCGLQSFLSSA